MTFERFLELIRPFFVKPDTFLHSLGAQVILVAALLLLAGVRKRLSSGAGVASALAAIIAVALFADNWLCYFAAIFIVATTVTDNTFLLQLAETIRGKTDPTQKVVPSGIDITSQRMLVTKEEEASTQVPVKRSRLQLKILLTLWTKQVDLFPDMDKLWLLKISPASTEFGRYKRALGELIDEGLVSETEEGFCYITQDGFAYCARHHAELGADQWYPEHQAKQSNMDKVLMRYKSRP